MVIKAVNNQHIFVFICFYNRNIHIARNSKIQKEKKILLPVQMPIMECTYAKKFSNVLPGIDTDCESDATCK